MGKVTYTNTPDRVDQAVEGALGRPDATEPLYLDTIATTASSNERSFTVTNSWGKRVWSMISTVRPSSPSQMVR